MNFFFIVIVCVIAIVVLFLIINLVNWWHVSRQHYVKRIYPGDTYTVQNKMYKVPNLKLNGNAMILNEKFVIAQKDLLKATTEMLDHFKLEYWISGGTLLGFERHKTIIPWDDDCDLHTHWTNRSYMFSRDFSNDVKQFGLEVIFLRGSSIKYASREGAAVRIRKEGTITPIVDIFFVIQDKEYFAKVDKWKNGEPKASKKERWSMDELFPLERKNVDDMTLVFPQKPVDVLKQQYGDNVMTSMYARNVLFSHAYPFSLKFIWWKF